MIWERKRHILLSALDVDYLHLNQSFRGAHDIVCHLRQAVRVLQIRQMDRKVVVLKHVYADRSNKPHLLWYDVTRNLAGVGWLGDTTRKHLISSSESNGCNFIVP
jgi:hypothetical protein